MILLSILALLSTVQLSFQNSAPYYGVPVGSLFNAVDGTQGEIYASDSKTLTIVHFHHNAEPGCTSFMVGPPKSDQPTDNGSNREGVTLTVKSQKHQRNKRQYVARQPLVPQLSANNPNFHPFDWPFELAHLRVDESAKGIDSQPKQVQDPFNVELDDSELDNVTIPYVTADPEITYNFVTNSPEAPITRIRTMHMPEEATTVTSRPEILNETSTVETSVTSKISQKSTTIATSSSTSSRKSSTVTSRSSSTSSHSSAKASTQTSARRTTDKESNKETTDKPAVFGGFIEELSVDDLEGTTKKWTLPPNIPISNLPILPQRSRNSVVLHNKNPVIIESANNTQDVQGPFLLIPNGNNSINKYATQSKPTTIAPDSGSGESSTQDQQSSAEDINSGANPIEIPVEFGSGSLRRPVPQETFASGSGSGDDEYESEDTTEASKVTEAAKQGPPANRTFAQRIYARGSTTENPHSTIKSKKSTVWSSVPIITTTTQSSQKAAVEKPPVENRRQNQQRERQQQKEKSSQKSSQEKSGGIVWVDHTKSPSARQREDDIRNAAANRESIYTVHKGQTAAPVAGGGIAWGEGGKVKPQSRFWGPLPREPTEYFGGVNIPDEDENKGPGLTIEPIITRRSKNANRRVEQNEGVTFSFGFGSAADAGPPARQERPTSERRTNTYSEGRSNTYSESRSNTNSEGRSNTYSENRSSLSSRGSPASRPDNGPPAGPAPPSPRDPAADRRAEVQGERRFDLQAERHAAFGKQFGVSESSTSSSASVSTTLSSSVKSLQSTTPDPNALFYVVEDPRHRSLPPFVPPTGKPTQPPAEPANRDWIIVTDRPSKRNQKYKSDSDPQPPPANMILSKDTNVDTNFGKEKTVAESEHEVAGSLPSKDIIWSSDKNSAADTSFYSLPKSQDDTLTVTLPSSYKLTDFQWFGVYDHCHKQRTSFVNINELQAPEIAEIDGLTGWKYGVKSAKIRVVNCNTLMIKNFTFNGYGTTEAYFYVGSGDFPKNIVRKTRAYLVGPMRDDPLHNYKGEDALVRLPDGMKTFDINWIAVYNEKDNISYGHAYIPPLVVPPCDI